MCPYSRILILQDAEETKHIYNNSRQATLMPWDLKVLFGHSYMWWARNDFKFILYVLQEI
jgi:hypothetical protein